MHDAKDCGCWGGSATRAVSGGLPARRHSQPTRLARGMPSSRAHVPPACWAQVWSVVRGRGKRIPSGGTLVLGREQDCEGAPAGTRAFSQQRQGRERDGAAAATDSIASSLIQAPCCTHHATSLQGAASIRTRARPGQHGSALQGWGRLRAACTQGRPLLLRPAASPRPPPCPSAGAAGPVTRSTTRKEYGSQVGGPLQVCSPALRRQRRRRQ